MIGDYGQLFDAQRDGDQHKDFPYKLHSVVGQKFRRYTVGNFHSMDEYGLQFSSMFL